MIYTGTNRTHESAKINFSLLFSVCDAATDRGDEQHCPSRLYNTNTLASEMDTKESERVKTK